MTQTDMIMMNKVLLLNLLCLLVNEMLRLVAVTRFCQQTYISSTCSKHAPGGVSIRQQPCHGHVLPASFPYISVSRSDAKELHTFVNKPATWPHAHSFAPGGVSIRQRTCSGHVLPASFPKLSRSDAEELHTVVNTPATWLHVHSFAVRHALYIWSGIRKVGCHVIITWPKFRVGASPSF
jgi:hypothetical protein